MQRSTARPCQPMSPSGLVPSVPDGERPTPGTSVSGVGIFEYPILARQVSRKRSAILSQIRAVVVKIRFGKSQKHCVRCRLRQDWRRPETAISACANFFSRSVLTNFAKFRTRIQRPSADPTGIIRRHRGRRLSPAMASVKRGGRGKYSRQKTSKDRGSLFAWNAMPTFKSVKGNRSFGLRKCICKSLCLIHRCAVIVFAVQKQCFRTDFVYMKQGGAIQESCI